MVYLDVEHKTFLLKLLNIKMKNNNLLSTFQMFIFSYIAWFTLSVFLIYLYEHNFLAVPE